MHVTGEHSAGACGSCYDIIVETHLDDTWSSWLQGRATIERTAEHDGAHGRAVTLLTASVADQAALRGLLTALWDMNLTIVAVTVRMDERAGE